MKLRSLTLLAVALVACGDDEATTKDTTTSTTSTSDATTVEETAGDVAGETETQVSEPESCDPLDPSACALPFPSNLYLAQDDTTETGFRLEFGDALPRNRQGKPIDPEPYRRLDGYGVGTPLLVTMPNVDLTGLATEFNVDPSVAEDAKIVWFEVVDGEPTPIQVPYFVDRDLTQSNPAKRVLIVRPARLLRENAHEIVAFRNMVDTEGHPIPRSAAFEKLVTGDTADDPKLAARQATFDSLFQILEVKGVQKSELTLAWDFHTASNKALHGSMLQIRDEALAEMPDGPVLSELVIEEKPEDEYWALEIRGKIEVPNYNFAKPLSGLIDGDVYVFEYDADGKVKRNGMTKADFWLEIPKSAVDGNHTPHGLIAYGHGQNGLGEQVRGSMNGKIANAYNYIFFATDMWGMSEPDVAGIVDMLSDMSGFPRLSDRLQQGILNHVLLIRAMKSRLAANSEMTSRGIVVDPTHLYYSGISQGGIYGPTVVAVSPDIQRGHFGVPGNNYSFLLTRSRNFDTFFIPLAGTYPSRTDQLILLQAIEQLWEQADSVSYIRHLVADPFPLPDGSPGTAKQGLWAPAKGDVQVAPSSNDNLARSHIGISVLMPYDTTGAAPRTSVSGAEMDMYPLQGSGIVLYDFGNPWPDESVNLPPTSDAEDPHGKPRQEAHHSKQMDHFFRTGEIIDVCSDDGTPGCDPD